MGVDREYRIKVSTIADASGAQQASQALDQVKASSHSMGETSAAAQEKAGKAAEGHEGHLHALHKVFHGLNEIVPGLGIAMQAAFTPVGAAISVALMVLSNFKEKMKELDEQFQKLEDDAAKPLTARLEAQRETVVALAKDHAELADQLKHTTHSEMALQEQTARTIETQKAQAAALDQVQQAAMDSELARLQAKHAAGLTSEEQYQAAKQQIEERYRQDKVARDEAAAMREILAKRRAMQVAEANQGALNAAAEEADHFKAGAIESLHSLRSEQDLSDALKLTEANRINADKKVLGKPGGRTILEQFQTIGTGKSTEEVERWLQANYARGGQYYTGASNLYDEWDDATRKAAAAKMAFQQGPGVRAAAEVAADNATRDAARARGRATSNQDTHDQLQNEIGQMRTLYDIRHGGNVATDAAERDKAAYGSKYGHQAAALLDRTMGLPESSSGKDARQIMDVGAAIAGRSVDFRTAYAMLAAARNNQDVAATDTLRIVESILRSSSHIASRTKGIDDKTKALADQVANQHH